ncbi:MAG TPA: FHA domain-containing protein, partial [Candidatus Acidoferrales bacterium]|nr:FHA domain-containing protein [Candidatus Acidoferrales bacterium]
PSENRGAISRLVVIGSSPPREYSLDKPAIAIGSQRSNDVVLDDTTVSRRHATIARRPAGFELTDLESTNGTFVNGRRLQKSIALKRGDEIKFGSVRVAFDPASVAGRMLRGMLIVGVMFIAGYAIARYRHETRSVTSEPVAGTSPPASSSAAAAANTQSASAEPRAAEGSAPGSSGNPATAEPSWLARVNYYRAMVKLPVIVEDPELSTGDRAHTMYIVRNYHEAITHSGLGAEMHTEDPGKPNFTPEGLDAAKSSDMDVWSMRGVSNDPGGWGSPTWSIDGWMSLPFHRMPILNPRLTSAGFGLYCEAEACAAGLNLLKGSEGKMPTGAEAALPIKFPPDGGSVAMRSFENEWPNPLTSCPGYEGPSGVAITLQLGNWMDTHLGEYSVARVNPDGSRTAVEACGIDSTSYSNPDAYSQDLGRNVLKSYGTVVLIPRAPLDQSAKYAVSMTANGKQYNWTFATNP